MNKTTTTDKRRTIQRAIKRQFLNERNRALLVSTWKKKKRKTPSTGFCYLASHAYFQLIDGKENGFNIKRAEYGRTGEYAMCHYWIESPNGKIIDLTADQFPRGFKHYKNGVVSNRPPSQKAKTFIERVKESLAYL